MLVQLCLCVVTLIHLTSSQSTYDVIQQENDVSSCGRNDHVMSQLMTSVSQLVTAVSQIQTTVSQLQRSVAKLEAFNQQQELAGIRKFRWKCNIILNCQCV